MIGIPYIGRIGEKLFQNVSCGTHTACSLAQGGTWPGALSTAVCVDMKSYEGSPINISKYSTLYRIIF